MLLVSSSMKSGTPSAFSMIWSSSGWGMFLPLKRSRIIALTSACDNRVSECMVVFAWLIHVGRNSGRHDTTSNTRAWSIRLMISSISSMRRWIQPVRILEDAERGALDRKRQEHVDKRAYRPVLYLLRRKAG